jgi:hypothetical protein
MKVIIRINIFKFLWSVEGVLNKRGSKLSQINK